VWRGITLSFKKMKTTKSFLPTITALSLGLCLAWPLIRDLKAQRASSLPPLIESGLAVYASGGPGPAILSWRKGGPSAGDKEAVETADELKQLEKSLGHYKSYDLIERKEISKRSEILYLSLNFERGAVFANFLVYKTSKDWVVQNMDFNTEPTLIMPWLGSVREK
jgi:hypothetical protein